MSHNPYAATNPSPLALVSGRVNNPPPTQHLASSTYAGRNWTFIIAVAGVAASVSVVALSILLQQDLQLLLSIALTLTSGIGAVVAWKRRHEHIKSDEMSRALIQAKEEKAAAEILCCKSQETFTSESRRLQEQLQTQQEQHQTQTTALQTRYQQLLNPLLQKLNTLCGILPITPESVVNAQPSVRGEEDTIEYIARYMDGFINLITDSARDMSQAASRYATTIATLTTQVREFAANSAQPDEAQLRAKTERLTQLDQAIAVSETKLQSLEQQLQAKKAEHAAAEQDVILLQQRQQELTQSVRTTLLTVENLEQRAIRAVERYNAAKSGRLSTEFVPLGSRPPTPTSSRSSLRSGVAGERVERAAAPISKQIMIPPPSPNSESSSLSLSISGDRLPGVTSTQPNGGGGSAT